MTGKLAMDATAKTETIGPKGAKGFDAELPITKNELDKTVAAIWRLAELRKRYRCTS